MGAWGAEFFDDDVAIDFGAEIVESKTLAPLSDAFCGAKQKDGPLDYDAGVRALVAAEVLCAIGGQSDPSLPFSLEQWAAGFRPNISKDLCEIAVVAIEKVENRSDLAELWAESPDGIDWKRNVADLIGRLKLLRG